MSVKKFLIPENEIWIDQFLTGTVDIINTFLKDSSNDESIRNTTYVGAVNGDMGISIIIKYQRRFYENDIKNPKDNS